MDSIFSQIIIIGAVLLVIISVVLMFTNPTAKKERLAKEQSKFVENLKRLGYEDYELDHYLPDEYDSYKKLRKINSNLENCFKKNRV